MPVYNHVGGEIGIAYENDGQMLADAFNIIGEKIGMQPIPPQFNNPITVDLIDSVSLGSFYSGQGACTDGEYIWFGTQDSTIFKYKIADGTYVTNTMSGAHSLGHCNDMTYNPDTGYLYIATMHNDGEVAVLNSEDLSYVTSIYLTDENGNAYTVWQICYDRDANCYYSAHGQNMLVYDDAWQYVRSIPMAQYPSTAQGCETDGTYIYRLYYEPNLLDIFRVDGTHVTTIDLSVNDEPESIMTNWNGKYYVGVLGANNTMYYLYAANVFKT